MPHGMPYSLRLAISLALNDGQDERIMMEAISAISDDIMAVIKKYDATDLPIVLSVAKTITNTMQAVLTPSGKEIMETISKHTTCTAVDLGAIKKMKEAIENDE